MDLPPPGFRGLDSYKPVTISRRHLPHWRQDGATYFVTFRLADSLPKERLAQLKEKREVWMSRHPKASDAECAECRQEEMTQIEQWLDQGHGRCLLNHPEATEGVESAMRHFDGDRYRLFAGIVMPNHVHVVLNPSRAHPLERIIDSWKKFTSRQIHLLLGGSGHLWQGEFYDRIIRDTDELRRILHYLEKNEWQTGGRHRLWITPSWKAWWNRARM